MASKSTSSSSKKKSSSTTKKKSSSSKSKSTQSTLESTLKKSLKKGIKKNYKKKPLVAALCFVGLVLVTAGFAYLEYSGTTHVFHEAPAQEVTFSGVVYDDFQVRFLETGNWYTGDAVYIKAGDVDILIDAGSRKDSGAAIDNQIKSLCTDGKLEYVIATHAHEDHIAGFPGTQKQGIFYKYDVGTIIDFAKTNNTPEKSSGIYSDYVEARQYAIDRGAKHYTALEACNDSSLKKIKIADDIYMETLYQKYYEESATTENNYSVCTLFSYKEQHFLFTGDLEKPGETSLVQKNTLPKCELFKAGHHGSKTSSNTDLLKAIQPKVVCVCCCAGSSEYTKTKDNQFPTQDFINRVAPYTANIYVTQISVSNDDKTWKSMNGTINFSSDGQNYSVACSNNNTILKDTEWFKENRRWPL